MSDKIRASDGGLSAPAKRGRPRKITGDTGLLSGSEDTPNGDASPSERIERASPDESTEQPRFPIVDPLDIPIGDGDSADSGAGTGRRKGRPRGKRAKKEEAVSNLSALLKIERLLVTGCFFLANIASAPELEISEAEAGEIGDALKELQNHYPIGMSEKAIAWVNFSFAVGGVFGPRCVAIYKRPAVRKGPKIVDIRPGPAGPAKAAAVSHVPDIPIAEPTKAAVPSQMWPQPGGDAQEDD